MNTGNIKQFIGVAAISLLTACGSPVPDAALLQPGVSRELAQFRKEHFKEVRYNLFFSIPESREEAVTGKVDITLVIRGRQPVIIDFRGESEQVASVLLNGRKVLYTVKDEHIVIDTREVANGENRVTIEFTANDQSLNRRDEFLYTLLVPDRARTLFPCFDQPDMKSLFTLSLEVPPSWQAVANGAIEQVDSTSVTGRRRVYFRETEPLSTYLFSFVAGKLTRETYSRDGRNISIYHRETDPKKVAQCSDIASEVFDALDPILRDRGAITEIIGEAPLRQIRPDHFTGIPVWRNGTYGSNLIYGRPDVPERKSDIERTSGTQFPDCARDFAYVVRGFRDDGMVQ